MNYGLAGVFYDITRRFSKSDTSGGLIFLNVAHNARSIREVLTEFPTNWNCLSDDRVLGIDIGIPVNVSDVNYLWLRCLTIGRKERDPNVLEGLKCHNRNEQE